MAVDDFTLALVHYLPTGSCVSCHVTNPCDLCKLKLISHVLQLWLLCTSCALDLWFHLKDLLAIPSATPRLPPLTHRYKQPLCNFLSHCSLELFGPSTLWEPWLPTVRDKLYIESSPRMCTYQLTHIDSCPYSPGLQSLPEELQPTVDYHFL